MQVQHASYALPFTMRGGLGSVATNGHAAPSAFVRLGGVQEIKRASNAFAIANQLKIGPADQVGGGFGDGLKQLIGVDLATHKPPLLAVWGRNDPFFVPAGAEQFPRVNPNARVKFYDTGHFELETHAEEIGRDIVDFLGKVVR